MNSEFGFIALGGSVMLIGMLVSIATMIFGNIYLTMGILLPSFVVGLTIMIFADKVAKHLSVKESKN